MKTNERMRQMRERRGMSLKQLADATGVTKTHIWDLEQGNQPLENASYIRVCSIAAALGLSITQLMAESN